MVLTITLCLIYKPMLTIQTQKACNKNNTSYFWEIIAPRETAREGSQAFNFKMPKSVDG